MTVQIEYQLVRHTPRPDGTLSRVEGPKGIREYGLSFPIDRRGEEDSIVLCRCELVQDQDHEDIGFFEQDESVDNPHCGRPLPPGSIETASIQFDEMPVPFGQKHIDSLGILLEGQSMTRMDVTFSTPPKGVSGVTLTPGLVFMNTDNQAQDTLLVGTIRTTFSFADSTGEAWWEPVTERARTLCLEIEEKEPFPGAKYRLVGPNDPRMWMFALDLAKTQRIGANEQAALWIATDRASYDKITRRLDPAPSVRAYMRQLKRVHRHQLLDLEDPITQKLMDPAFLTVENAEKDILRWFVNERMQFDEKGTLAALQQAMPKIKQIHEGDALRENLGLLAGIGAGLIQSQSLEARRLALQLAVDCIPQSRRAFMAEHIVYLNDAGFTLTDAKTLEQWVDALILLQPTGWKNTLLNLPEQVPAAAKKRAEEAVGPWPPPAPASPQSHALFEPNKAWNRLFSFGVAALRGKS